MDKSFAPFSLRSEPILNGISNQLLIVMLGD